MKRVYFDNAATTPLSKEVVDAISESLEKLYGNPSSIHADGRMVRAAIEDARKRVAKHIGASIGEIFFTSGGTEANNMILKNAVRDLGIQRIISSPIEHHAVLHSLEIIEKTTDTVIEFVKIDEKGRVDIADLTEKLKGTSLKTLVSLMHSNNEIGTMIDLDEVSRICQEYNALFHSDTVQTMGFYPIDVSKTKINFLNASAHKFHGPKGIGFVYINSDSMLKPFIEGGSQERNMRGGTENVYGIIGLAKALDMAYEGIDSHKEKIIEVRNYLKIKLLENFEDIRFLGVNDPESVSATEGGHYKVLNVSFPPSPKAELLLFNLDIAGISASGGSACSSGAEGGSHVLNALKIDPNRKCIRFSFSHYNTLNDVNFLIEKLKTMTPVLKEEGVS
jgi:cysteine desulfurase